MRTRGRTYALFATVALTQQLRARLPNKVHEAVTRKNHAPLSAVQYDGDPQNQQRATVTAEF